jgi:3-deoxy-D-manno-octulosonic-acid transferase
VPLAFRPTVTGQARKKGIWRRRFVIYFPFGISIRRFPTDRSQGGGSAETEPGPTSLRTARTATPVVLVNGRISTTHPALSASDGLLPECADRIGVDGEDKRRLIELGAAEERVMVTGTSSRLRPPIDPGTILRLHVRAELEQTSPDRQAA